MDDTDLAAIADQFAEEMLENPNENKKESPKEKTNENAETTVEENGDDSNKEAKDVKSKVKSNKKKKLKKKKKENKDQSEEVENKEAPAQEEGGNEKNADEDKKTESKKGKKKKKGKKESEGTTQNEKKGKKSVNNTTQNEIPNSKLKKKKKSNDDKSQITAGSKTEKVSKIKSSEIDVSDPKSAVLNYLITQNRPYSSINIFDNLHGLIKKSQLGKILDALTEEKKIICKEYSTKVYLANQDNFPEIKDEELTACDAEIEALKKEIAEGKATLQSLQNENKRITSEYTDEELAQVLNDADEKLKLLETKVTKIENNAYEKIPDEKMAEAEKILEGEKVKYRKIKKICMGILDEVSEGFELKTSALMEQIGIENDKELLDKYKIEI